MKILLLQDHLRSGGTERQTVLLARAFAESGHQTSVITFRPGGALAPTLAATVKAAALQPFDTHLDWFAPGLLRTVGQVDADVVLCMGRMANCYGGRLQARFPRMIVISTMRTGKSLPAAFRRSLQQSSHVIANSHDAAKTLTSVYRVAPKKISVIHNSLIFPPNATALADEQRRQLRTVNGAEDVTTVLLSVAMFRPEKGQRELIEIAAGFPTDFPWQLWLAGEGEAKSRCERLVAEKNLGPRVKFLGWLKDPTPLYAAADVAVHASTSESLSNFLIEAQAQGLPAVASAAQGITECFLPADTGFVIAPGNEADFRETVITLARSSAAERQARSERARAFARGTFDPQRQVAAYLDLFQELLSASRSA